MGTVYVWRRGGRERRRRHARPDRRLHHARLSARRSTRSPPKPCPRARSSARGPCRRLSPTATSKTGCTSPTATRDGTLAKQTPRAASAMADHTGWPAVQCLKMDKGAYGFAHTLVGLARRPQLPARRLRQRHDLGRRRRRRHLGRLPALGPARRASATGCTAAPAADWIYSSHGHDEIWTGAGDDHVALVYGWGTVHCNGPGLKTLVMRLLRRNRHWRLHRLPPHPHRALPGLSALRPTRRLA